jgi:photosystem II stability/assembly factor-like uncharacterized protein
MNARHAIVAFAVLQAVAAQGVWRELGPAPISSGPYTGRVAAVATSRSQPDRYYVGGADGGVWRTDNGGVTWVPLGDHLPVTAIGALALDPNDDRILFAGLGEANFANHSRYGLGIARTFDAGSSWEVHGAATFGGRCISRIRIDPGNTARLYATVTGAGGFPALAAARNHPGANGPLGLFRSTDRGVTWAQLGGGIPTDLDATDVLLDPANPATIFVAFGRIFGDARNGIYKSTDGGASFTRLAGGLPAASVGRITLAVAPSSGRLVASIARVATADGGSSSALGAWRSDDRGATWVSMSAPSLHATYGWYLNTAVVHPTDPNRILLGGLSCVRTLAGGGSWTTVTPPHVDLHALEYDAAGRLVCGNDGGVHRSTNDGTSWQSLNTYLGLVQFYAGVSLHPGNRDLVYGGAQDNGTLRRTGTTAFASVLGGDGGCTGIDPTGTRVFAEYQGTAALFRSTNGGSFTSVGAGISGRNCFLPPYAIHPVDGLRMVYGTERVFLSTNGGTGWAPISPDLTSGGIAAIRGILFAPSDPQTIWVSTNDGRVQMTANGGTTWNLRRTGVPGWPRTTWPFAIHPTKPAEVYFAVGSFGTDQVLHTSDAGVTWRRLDGNLPDLPVHTVALDLQSGEPPILYVGTDRGVWRSEDHGRAWELHGPDLPHTPVIDLRVDPANRRLVAATQGRGIWESLLPPRGTSLGAGLPR